MKTKAYTPEEVLEDIKHQLTFELESLNFSYLREKIDRLDKLVNPHPELPLSEIKEGNYLLYSESNVGDEYDYADSLDRAVMIDGKLTPTCLATRNPDDLRGFSIIPGDGSHTKGSHTIPFEDYYDPKCWKICDYTPDQDPIEYCKKAFS